MIGRQTTKCGVRPMPGRPHHQPTPATLLDPLGLRRTLRVLLAHRHRIEPGVPGRSGSRNPTAPTSERAHETSPGVGCWAFTCAAMSAAAPVGSVAGCRLASDHSKNSPEESTVTQSRSEPVRIIAAGRASLMPTFKPILARGRHRSVINLSSRL
jgi:hypothetical protein